MAAGKLRPCRWDTWPWIHILNVRLKYITKVIADFWPGGLVAGVDAIVCMALKSLKVHELNRGTLLRHIQTWEVYWVISTATVDSGMQL